MGSLLNALIWAQADSVSSQGVPNSLVLLVPKRWYSQLCLSSPETVPGIRPVWAFLTAMVIMILLAMVCQGPAVALRQLIGVREHLRYFREGIRRLRASSKIVSILIGMTVFSWTAGQTLTFRREEGKSDLLLMLKSRGVVELGLEQGLHASLTSFRDVAALGDNLPLLLLTTFLFFRLLSNSRDGSTKDRQDLLHARFRPSSRRLVLIGSSLLVYCGYRITCRTLPSYGLPVGGCVVLEVVVIPLAMLVCDGLTLGWILTELRDAGSLSDGADMAFGDLRSAVKLIKNSMAACLLLLPARYVVTMVLLLILGYLPSWFMTTGFGAVLRWLVGSGICDLQALGLVFAGIVGIVPWTRGNVLELPRAWFRLTSEQGGRVVAVLAAMGISSAMVAGIPYFILLLLPFQTWTFAAADSYSHYLTFPVALLGLSTLVELGLASLPTAARKAARVEGHKLEEFVEPLGL